MPKPILYIDDQPHYALPYVESLQAAGYEVFFQEDAESGLEQLRSAASTFSIVILDYMMPTPNGVPETDTFDGLATGRWLIRQARQLLESCSLPVIVLTNRNVDTVQKEIEEFAALQVGSLIRVRHKTHTPRARLPVLVSQVLGG